MAVNITRSELVKIVKSYDGVKQGSKKHKELVDTFNTVKPHGEKATYTCAWCAITYTACAIKAGFTTKNFPMSYNCGTLIEDAKKLKMWEENDNYLPKIGDGIIYYWSDTGKGDCKAGASHVGTVISVSGNTFKVMEGNKGTTCTAGIRTVTRNQIYIRGFITPEFAVEKKKETKAVENKATEEKKETIKKITVSGKWNKATSKLTQQVLGCSKVDSVISSQKKSVEKYIISIGSGAWEFVKADSAKGSATIKKIQKLIGVKETGFITTSNIKSLQKFLNKKKFNCGEADGIMGVKTVTAWQKYLNSQVK